mgnify:CR=1 FL=1
MTNEELIKRLQDFAAGTMRDEDAKLAFEAISALSRDRWISVEGEGFPDKSGEYLFYGDQYFVPDHHGDPDNYKNIKSGYWMVNQSLPNYIGNMFFTHWMPLPEPPKEEHNGE